MNARAKIEELLEADGAKLIRQKTHLVFRLSTGRNFVLAKTESDHRAMANSLSDLRKMLPERGQQLKVRVNVQPQALRTTNGTPAHMAQVPPPPAQPAPGAVPGPPAPPVPQPAGPTLKERLESAIEQEEAAQERLLAVAQGHENRVKMLRALAPFVEDTGTADMLRALLPPPAAPPESQKVQPPPPPDRITDFVQVTRQLVHAATQTFDADFTVNDVVLLMAGERELDGQERLRVRNSIAQCMTTLAERGELLKVSQGIGRQQSTWRNVPVNGTGAAGTRE